MQREKQKVERTWYLISAVGSGEGWKKKRKKHDSEAVGGWRPGEKLVRQTGRFSAQSFHRAAGGSPGDERLPFDPTVTNS